MGYLVNGVTITLLEGFEEDAEGAHMGCPDGQLLDSSSLECVDDSMEDSVEEARRPDPQQARYERQMQVAFLRTQQLRTMIEWGDSAIERYNPVRPGGETVPELMAALGEEVAILVWPSCKIEYFARGTTAGDVIRQRGLISVATQERVPLPPEGLFSTQDLLVNVNNR